MPMRAHSARILKWHLTNVRTMKECPKAYNVMARAPFDLKPLNIFIFANQSVIDASVINKKKKEKHIDCRSVRARLICESQFQ